MRRKWWLLGGPCVAVALTLLSLVAIFGPNKVVFWGEINVGNTIVARIRVFKSYHHRLPASEEEAGVPAPLRERYSYQKCGDARFALWFGTERGESMTYDSATGAWQPSNSACNAAVLPKP